MSAKNAVSDCFSTSYQESRRKFLDAAAAMKAELTSIPHPEKGPDGEDIFMDVACVGADDSKAAIVVVSGTHGIEGFCGAGIQTNVLRNTDAVLDKLDGTKLILLHGHNPYGFAWLRRVNEDNIDLNRNYVDFSEPQEMNEAYLAVKDLVLPAEFNDESEAALSAWIEEHGLDEYQRVIMGGQRVDPEGVFYGGMHETWSRKMVFDIVPRLTDKQENVALIDIHTGLGPYGHGDLIHAYPKGSHEYDDLRAWYGDEIIAYIAGEYGDVVAAVPRGPVVSSLDLILPNKRSYAYVIEYGTLDFERVIRAIRADNWLHLKGDLDSEKGREIKDEMRACFYSESDEWRQMIWDRALWSIDRLVDGLSGV